MKKIFLTLVLFTMLFSLNSSIQAQQINLTATSFQYKFTDNTYNGSNHTYVAWEILTNHNKTLLCSTVYNLGTVYPGTVYTCPQNVFYGMTIDASGYLIGIIIVRDQDPFGSHLNRGGYSGPLFPDPNDYIYPSNIAIVGW
ncbi:MAG: hypothetical protein ABSD71_12235 [Bacteroidales bacterium]|jgi:hypothetical protein